MLKWNVTEGDPAAYAYDDGAISIIVIGSTALLYFPDNSTRDVWLPKNWGLG